MPTAAPRSIILTVGTIHTIRSTTVATRVRKAGTSGQGTWQGLADGEALAHFFLRQPFLVADHLALHLADERDGATEAEQTESQVVLGQVANGHGRRGRFWGHGHPFGVGPVLAGCWAGV